MRLIICDTPEKVGDWAARYVQYRIQQFAPTADRPFVLGLPTGSTPVLMYQQLIELHQAGNLSFQHVVTFNMDEYVGLSAEHPQSYHAFMDRHLFNHIDIPRQNIHILDGMAADVDAECRQYEEKIRSFGGIELFIGGVGEDGHIAFNEPGSSLQSRTRIKTLTYRTQRANARFFNDDITKVPKCALTVGVGTIMDAREVMILAQGYTKAMALAQAIEGSVNHMWTISALQLHPQSLIVCDEEATLELKVKTVKYFKELECDSPILVVPH
ncbi:MAG: glucosamine-6-phosphate deaminase [Synechococcales cyanobacterium C42_A2020_086]|nr:glucosamine-6-phosphate deaminase [Synechococcales cyanobacterium C42_A2020_086]